MRIPSGHQMKQSALSKWIVNFCNKNWVAKTIALVIIWAFISIPFDLYLLIRWGLGPEGFWEELAMMLVAIICIGWIQGILLFFGIIITFGIIFDDL